MLQSGRLCAHRVTGEPLPLMAPARHCSAALLARLFPWRSPCTVALLWGKAFHCLWTFTFEGLVYTVLGSFKKKKTKKKRC